ncbi:MAG: agmatinase [SAR324 cluster bacterium]|nr:agmatinase [SAR324 cluster bacterium]
MTDYPPFAGDDAKPVSYAEARVAVLPVPYEGTVTYGRGAAGGPRAILEASAQLEMYDEELDRRIDEAGIVTLPPVEPGDAGPEEFMERIRQAALPPARDGKLLVTLGGEHSISFGVWRALLEARGKPFAILQIDGHADLRPTYGGTPHSHASIMARAHDLGLPFVQVGLRAVSEGERDFLRREGLEPNVFWAHRIAGERDGGWIERVVERLAALGHRDVYITIDLDGLDPALVPATGTPEPGGLQWYETLALLRKVAEDRCVIGFDVTELAPIPGLHAPNYLAARLAYKLMGYALWEGAPQDSSVP